MEDKAWFQDREFWPRYLDLLAASRFNRFHLALGIGYDFTTDIRDCYFHFAYPFLLAVPGYAVRANPLPDAERDRNLEMLRFISEETARRGLHFQLGLWTHAYQWTQSPNANYLIEGLTPATHAPYCRDALRALLTACPAIRGVTFRIHGESGVPEGNYDLWKTIFDGAAQCGRRVEIDMHAKGMDQGMIDTALGTGLPVTISPKFWAEHTGLPYMQGAIRPLEKPPRNARASGVFKLSSGARQFLRYGYGDLLTEDRRYGVLHRLWPGTQRLLLWGDPQTAAGYGRAAGFCGSNGMEIFEPLFFKGRKGSGLPGGRDGYADLSLRPAGGDFEKYRYTYRVWGRCLYNPDGDPEAWRRLLRHQFGRGAEKVEQALASASRILPLVTTAHCPSAANYTYWPEIYTHMPIVNENRPHPYTDTPSPRRFGTVSPLDPEFFLGVDEFAQELVKPLDPLNPHGLKIMTVRSGKYSPAWVARQLEEFADNASASLREAKTKVADSRSADFRRLANDIAIQAGLGRFFAAKFRSGMLLALFQSTADRAALVEALKANRASRGFWAELAAQAKDVYRSDLTFGYDKSVRGHWLDRLPHGPGHRRHGKTLGEPPRYYGGAHHPRQTCHPRSTVTVPPPRCRPPGGIPHAAEILHARPALSRNRLACPRQAGAQTRASPPPLPSRQPGGDLAIRRNERLRRGLPRRNPSGLHRFPVPAPIPFRVFPARRRAWTLSRPPSRLARPSLFRGAPKCLTLPHEEFCDRTDRTDPTDRTNQTSLLSTETIRYP